jgi:hypothetical protein
MVVGTMPTRPERQLGPCADWGFAPVSLAALDLPRPLFTAVVELLLADAG